MDAALVVVKAFGDGSWYIRRDACQSAGSLGGAMRPYLADLIKLRESLRPDVVLCPSLQDIHQDHATVAREALRAFKRQTILCYEEPWNNIAFSTNAFERLDEEILDTKMKALECYESQKKRAYFTQDMMRSLAITRGCQLEGGYAEAFEVVRYML